jgi:exopolysaccharide biosynthesis polyprenyl glycosylphosphotransferase
MSLRWKRDAFILFLGDLAVFAAALYATLFLRHLELPNNELLAEHFLPFSVLFAIWTLVFFIAGLYDRQTNVLKRKLSSLIVRAQVVNSVIAVFFFYFISVYRITPKVNLFIYLIMSVALILIWRMILADFLYGGRRENILLVGGGQEIYELEKEISANPRYKMNIIRAKDFNDTAMLDAPKRIFTIIADLGEIGEGKLVVPRLPELLMAGVRFIDFRQFYEDVFNRIPLSALDDGWFLESISNQRKIVYDTLKRLMDVLISAALGVVAVILYPFIAIAIKLDDGGEAMIYQERIGQNNKIFKISKFRSMKASDSGMWVSKNDDRVTRVGKALRKTRLDELPQLWSVLKGDMSLIGPRPDIRRLGEQLREQIPYYTMRHLIKSGLSGWAQIHQGTPPQSLEATKERLSYDFYYLKNRSFLLDLEIALKTIKTLLSRAGL